jgi:hypothetical protein
LQPFHLVVVCGVASGAVFASRSITDLDFFWHLLAGKEILDRHTTRGVGADWVFAVDARGWHSPEWLAEVLSYQLYRLGGFGLIRGLTLALAVALSVAVMRGVVRARALPATSMLGAVVIFTLGGHFEDRPLLLSLVALALLAPAFVQLARSPTSQLPTLPLVLGTLVWAQVHGYWLLIPASLILAAVCRAADRRTGLLEALRPANQATLCLLAACLNPAGPSLLLAPFRFHGATEFIGEWKATNVREITTWGLLLLVAIAVTLWARADHPVERSEILWVLSWTGFAVLAMRNVPPAMFMIAPIVADRLAGRSQRLPEPRGVGERRALAATGACLLVLASAAVALRLATTPTLPEDIPRGLIQTIRNAPGEHRVLNSYNVAGMLEFFGGPHVKVALDGRADLSAPILPDYLDLISASGDFEPLLDKLRPDAALVDEDAGIVRYLLSRGWTHGGTEDGYALVLAPSFVP